MERPEGGSIGVPRGRPTVCSRLWLWRQEASSLQHLRGQGPSAAEAWERAQGGNKVQVSRLTFGPRAAGAEGNPDVAPNDALGSVCVHTCVWELFMLF